MIIAAFACFIAGALLGTRFRVAILLPTMLVSMGVTLSIGVLGGQEFSQMIASQITTLTALQFGYLSSALIAARPVRKLYRPDAVTVPFGRD